MRIISKYDIRSGQLLFSVFSIKMCLIPNVDKVLKRIKAAQVSGIELSTPFFAAILGFFILGKTVTAMQIVGIFLLFVGIYCLSKREDKN